MKTSVLIKWMLCAGLWAGVETTSFAQADGWTQRYSPDKGSSDLAAKVITDAQDNVIVVGSTDDNLTGPNALIIKYSSAGVPVWTNRHGGWRYGSDLAADSSGNVFVIQYSSAGGGPATVAYSSAGVPLWTNRFASGFYTYAAGGGGGLIRPRVRHREFLFKRPL